MELTVGAVPGYFATMAIERAYLRRRARRLGPSAADYERRDTLASLAMGTGSLLAPFIVPRALERLLVRSGRLRRGVLWTTIGAVAATTVCDRMVSSAERGNGEREEGHPPAAHTLMFNLAKTVSSLGGAFSVVVGGLSVCTLWARWTSNDRLWASRLLPDLGTSPLVLAAAIVGWDFIYYWNHRFQHESRFLWAIHVVHHSSERYNLSTALRQPVADAFGTFLPYGALSMLGIRPRLVETARGVNLLYQYWIHTEAIGKLGPLEKVLNVPSHHRVHHGSNKQYIDRNHGSILIIWDRLFGSFEPEGDRVVYGLTKNIGTFNPLRIAGREHADMVRDVLGASSWRERLSYVLRGPGWSYERRRTTGSTPLGYIRPHGELRPGDDTHHPNGRAQRTGVRPSR